jgi:hypothetical protein
MWNTANSVVAWRFIVLSENWQVVAAATATKMLSLLVIRIIARTFSYIYIPIHTTGIRPAYDTRAEKYHRLHPCQQSRRLLTRTGSLISDLRAHTRFVLISSSSHNIYIYVYRYTILYKLLYIYIFMHGCGILR